MRVVQLTTSFQLWGAERVVLELSRRLHEDGVDVRVGAIRDGAGDLGSALKAERIPTFATDRAGHSIEGWWALARWVRAQRPDVVHAHLWAANVLSGVVAPRHTPLIWSHHNLGYHLTGFRGASSRWLWSRPDVHTFVSETSRRRHHEDLRLPRGRSRVIPNGIPTERFATAHPRPGPVIGAVGRFVPTKGFDVLLRAAKELAPGMPGLRVRILGDGPERESLMETARELEIYEHVSLEPWSDDVAGFLAAVNVFVMPSRHEGFGMTLLEALATGLPCVASDLAALREVGGDAVRWVAPDDVEALVGAIRGVSDDAWSEARVGERRARASSFSVESMVSAYVELYRELRTARGRPA